MHALSLALVFAAGFGLMIQVGLNTMLRTALGHPTLAAIVNFVVGLVALLVVALIMQVRLPTAASVATAPAWAWLSGCLGAFYVAVAAMLGARLGAATLLAVIVFGQMVASLVVDHYGLVGFPVQPLSLTRLAGAALLLGGVVLVVRG